MVNYSVTEPGYAESIKLSSAPASTLPRPFTGFEDTSLSIFYNLRSQTGDYGQYYITKYNYSKAYTSRNKIESDVVPGVYTFLFPVKNNPTRLAPIAATIRNNVEGYAKVRNKSFGFRFTGLNFTSDGFAVMDYSSSNVINWEGITSQLAYASADKLYFSVQNLVAAPAGDPARDIIGDDGDVGDTSDAAFPPVSGSVARIRLPNPFVKTYALPPASSFFTAGGEYVVQITLVREFGTSGIFDGSTRYFQLPIKFFNLYSTYSTATFTDKKLKKKQGKETGDYDGDGVNNITEWAMGTSAANAAASTKIALPNVSAGVAYAQSPSRALNTRVAPYPAVDKPVYTAQISTNGGVSWSNIVSGVGGWTVTNNDGSPGTVTVSNPTPPTSGQIRLIPSVAYTY